MGTVQVINPNTGRPMTVTAGSKVHQNYLKNNPSAVIGNPSTPKATTPAKQNTTTPSYSIPTIDPLGRYSSPSTSQPSYSQPKSSQPSYSQPSYSQPSYSQPSYSSPTQTTKPTSPTMSTGQTPLLDFSKGTNQRVDIINPTTGKSSSVMVNEQTFNNYLKKGYKVNQGGQAVTNGNFTYQPGQMANNTAKFGLGNMGGNSGVFVDGYEVDHQTAMAVNPLHPVNGNRQSLIQDSIKTGNWANYNNFEAGQSPLTYDKGADGNYTQNKKYYADLISSDYDSMVQAQMAGDSFGAGEWERSLKERIEKYNNAPGMAVYIPRIHDSGHGQGNMYGIQDYDDGYFDSVYNQGSTGFIPHENTVNKWLSQSYDQNDNLQQWLYNNFADGDGLGQSWATNAVFKDNPDLLNAAMSASNGYGSAEEQAVRQGINEQAMKAYLDSLSPQYPQAPAVQAPIPQMPTYQMPSLPEITLPTINIPTPAAPQGNLEHIYSPGQSANIGGYTDNQLVDNATLVKYLDSIYKGGF